MAATSKKLGLLHDKVADALLLIMEGKKIPIYGDPDDPDKITEYEHITPSAAEIQAAAKFLSDNDITCVPTEDNKLGELEEAMAAQKAKREARRRATQEELDAAKAAGDFLTRLQ